ncbi:proline utilization trans-activator [Microdochium nivale]|nr:proline utilization trans-activator [Microdochium nivale]
MGRKQHPIIAQYFDRGAKLADNSNRYEYRCRNCGEHFPKGRLETLTLHITKRCPAITEAERVNACLALHGINSAAQAKAQAARLGDAVAVAAAAAAAATASATTYASAPAAQDVPITPAHGLPPAPFVEDQNWTPLQTLAEVSRQIEANEKHDEPVPAQQDELVDLTGGSVDHTASLAHQTSNLFELHDQLALDHPGINYEDLAKRDPAGKCPRQLLALDDSWQFAEPYPATDEVAQPSFDDQQEMTPEERIAKLLQGPDMPSQTALSVAVAATARLNPSLLDPQLLDNEPVPEVVSTPVQSADMLLDYSPSSALPTPPTSLPMPASSLPMPASSLPMPTTPSLPMPTTSSLPMPTTPTISSGISDAEMTPHSGTPIEDAAPWMGMTYMPDVHAPPSINNHAQQLMGALNKGGFRMDAFHGPNGIRHRHSRARFDSDRRREVQEVRRIGACIRCRILRKTCSKGTPCDTCKKVLSPRVWRTGCVRTKLSEYIDLYSAGVQVVMAQKRFNSYKTSHCLGNTGVVVEVSHFPETGHHIVFEVLQGCPMEANESTPAAMGNVGLHPVILLDNDKEDVPTKIETYMKQILPDLISREPSSYVRVTLETAVQVANATNDELLRRSLELWGIVEIMDRERQWNMLAKSPTDDFEDHWIKDESESEPYTNICMQLNAGAERKAAAASKSLLNGIQRNLQDGKLKLGFPMFLTVMLFMNCVEKTTWSFKAWDQENLRPKWPLEKQPSSFTNQGHGLCELLRMLLSIRHILPKTTSTDPTVPIVSEDQDPAVQKYYQDLSITPVYLRARHEQNHFSPTDSRSLEFLYCAPLLLSPAPMPGPPSV